MTKQNGKDLEEAIFHAVRNALESGHFGLDPRCAKVYRGKGYYSRDRGREIVTDISVEISKTNAPEPSILWIFECKDYKGPIPVDDIEEFHAKLEQIGADRTKGTVVARSSFQRSAYAFALSKGIGLARWLPEEQIMRDVLYAEPVMLPINEDKYADAFNIMIMAEFAMTHEDYKVPIDPEPDSDPSTFGAGFYSIGTNGQAVPGAGVRPYVIWELCCWHVIGPSG